MQTPDASPAADLARPLAGWEVAARWNRAALDWMAKGWQQWIALMTTLPPHFVATPDAVTPAPHPVTPAQAGVRKARSAHAAARAEPQRATRAKPKSKTKKTTSARTRG